MSNEPLNSDLYPALKPGRDLHLLATSFNFIQRMHMRHYGM